MLLKLTYTRKSDKFVSITVLSSPEGIRDLYWQLTHNYSDNPDGTAIGGITVTNLDGFNVTKEYISDPYSWCTHLDENLN